MRRAIRHLLFCCAFLSAGLYARGDEVPELKISFDARQRARVSWQGSETHYYQLYRSDQPGALGEAVAMRLGGLGTLDLVDSLPSLNRAFYRLRLIPLDAALDTDADGTSDAIELSALPFANPLNAADSIDPFDGAIYVPDQTAFEALSHLDNFPGAANVREVKFLILNADGPAPELYFVNANQHIYHYYFSVFALGYPYSLNTFNNETYFTNIARRNIAGSLVVHENYAPADGGPAGIITMEFWPSDPVAYRFVQLAYDMVTRSMPWVETRIAYHPASQTQRALYQTEIALYQAARQSRLHVITTEELFGQVSYTLLNPGVAFGRLVLADASTTLTARDIPVFRVLPNDLTHVAGVITSVVQTPLSHVNLKAKQNNLPNAYVKNAETHPLIAPLLGKYVRYETMGGGFTLREASQAEVDQHIEALRPANPQFPARDLTAINIQPLSAIGFASAPAYGAKAANVAELRKFLPSPMVPDGYAIPLFFYDEFMKANGLYTIAQSMMADPRFTSDADYRAGALSGFRNLIKNSGMPAWMTNSLTAVQAAFPASLGIRCRSSANAEDLPTFNGAGLYDSFTHRSNEGHLSKSVKQVWASLWNLRAWDEREFFRVDHLTSAMGVLLHPNFDDEACNGVAVTKNIIDPNWTGYYVNAQLGESLVTNPDPNAVPEEFLIAQLAGATRYEIQHVTFSSLLPAGQTVMTRAHAEQLADTMSLIQARFKSLYQGGITFAMEIEFKVTSANQLVIKQARPYAE